MMKSIYQKYQWTKVARRRLNILRQYEPLQPHVFLSLRQLMGADNFVDIGANIGAYSILISPFVERIHAFEPSPATFRELERNVELNGLAGKVVLHDVALSDSEKTAQFAIVGEYSGANSLTDTSIHTRKKLTNQISVRCAPLDDVLPELRNARLAFKIDVEGHETPVLIGGKETFTHNSCLIQIENYQQESPLDATLRSYGYHELLHLGPDYYYSNVPNVFTDRAIVDALQDAAEQLIADLRAKPEAESASEGL